MVGGGEEGGEGGVAVVSSAIVVVVFVVVGRSEVAVGQGEGVVLVGGGVGGVGGGVVGVEFVVEEDGTVQIHGFVGGLAPILPSDRGGGAGERLPFRFHLEPSSAVIYFPSSVYPVGVAFVHRGFDGAVSAGIGRDGGIGGGGGEATAVFLLFVF